MIVKVKEALSKAIPEITVFKSCNNSYINKYEIGKLEDMAYLYSVVINTHCYHTKNGCVYYVKPGTTILVLDPDSRVVMDARYNKETNKFVVRDLS